MAHVTLASEADRMDRHYRFQRLVYDRTRTHYLIGRKHLIKDMNPSPGECVLEIGCGTAWNLTQALRHNPKAHFFGVDISKAMLETATASLKRQRIDHQIILRQGDATSFDAETLFGRATFDHVFFSYALSMIPNWKTALAHGTHMIAPGGRMSIVDFGQCDRLPAVVKRALFRFLDHYSVTPRADLKSTIEEIADANGYDVHTTPLHRGYTAYYVIHRPR